MDLTFRELARHAAHRTAPENFEVTNVDEAFREELKKYAGSINQFMKNRYDLYDLIIENADDIVPNKVIDAVGIFAEVMQIPQNGKAVFRTSNLASKMRAKKFLTAAALSGVYESFRLDSGSFEVGTHAIGSAVTVDFERMLDGTESLADVMDVIVDGLTDATYVEVQKALRATVDARMPEANRVIETGFDASMMVGLCNTARAYGSGAVIFAPPEFVAAMGPDAIVPVGTNYQGIYHPQDIDRIHNQGYINLFRGCPIVMLPQSFVDEKNEKTWIDPQMAYIFPTGKERIVKVVFEGQTQTYDWVNKDQSLEVQFYKKLGVGILTYHNFCVYQNTDITQTMYNPYPNI